LRFSQLFAWPPFGRWVWCSCCQRVYRRQAWEANELLCPDPRCDGGPLDAMTWDERRALNPSLPAEPRDGASYPFYP
jgi:hypothetical protein